LLPNFCNLNSKLHCQAFQKSNGSIGSIPKLSCNGPSGKEQVFASASLTPLTLGVWGFPARQLPLARRDTESHHVFHVFRSKLNDSMDPQVFNELVYLVCIPLYLRFLGGGTIPNSFQMAKQWCFAPNKGPQNESI
jgi:hypothetical protein